MDELPEQPKTAYSPRRTLWRIPSGDVDWHPPLALKIVAFLFILSGVLAVTESVLQLSVFGRFDPGSFVFGALSAFAGRGLLRWRNAWRRFALFWAWLYVAMGCIMVAMSIWDIVTKGRSNIEFRIGSWSGSGWLGIPIGLLIVVFAHWVARVLNRRDVVKRFFCRHLAKDQNLDDILSLNPRRWRFSLATMFVSTIIVAFVLARVTAKDVLYETRHLTQSGGTASGLIRGVEFGVRSNRLFREQDELLYVVLSQGEKRWKGSVRQRRVNRINHPTISTLYDGDREINPATHQLYEIVDGKVQTRNERVSLNEFDDFVKSGPADWSLEALVKHAESLRAQQAEKRDH